MSEDIGDGAETLRRDMEAAAAAGDFELAAVLRDRLSLARAGVSDAGNVDVSGLTRQQPGKMGLGSGRAAINRPEGWTAPRKPDPLTANVSRPKRPRRS